jgi:SAM-dependent methyltransferase
MFGRLRFLKPLGRLRTLGVTHWTREAIGRYGVIGAVKYLGTCVWERMPMHPWNHPDEYDLAHGIDTHRKVRNTELRIDSPFAKFGSAYQPVHPKEFHALVRAAEIDHGKYTFVDFGSGKGRALFFASDYPFVRILGVEFAPELHAIALRNLERFRSPTQRCHDITPVLADAATFELPPGPLCIYFYHPFQAAVMQRVVANVEASLRASPRPIVILYYDPVDRELWDQSPFFEHLHTSVRYTIYRTLPHAQSAGEEPAKSERHSSVSQSPRGLNTTSAA